MACLRAGRAEAEVWARASASLLIRTPTNSEAEELSRDTRHRAPYALFSVAVAKGKEKTVYFPVTLFGESAELAGEMLSKGSRVLVEGTLDVDPDSGKFRVLARTFCRA